MVNLNDNRHPKAGETPNKKNKLLSFIGYIIVGIILSLGVTVYDSITEGKPSNLIESNLSKVGSIQTFHFDFSFLSVGEHEIGIATRDGILMEDIKDRGEYIFEYYVDGELLEKKRVNSNTIKSKNFFKMYSSQSNYSRLPLDVIQLPFKGRYREFDLKITVLKPESTLLFYKKMVYLYCGKQDKFISKVMKEENEYNTRTKLIRTPIDANQSNIIFQPLHNALRAKDFMEVKRIIELDNNITANTEMLIGRTPVHYAAFYNDIKTLQYLIKNNADLCKEDFRKETPLSYAISHLSVDTTKLLLDSGITNDKVENISRYFEFRNYPFDIEDNETFKLKIINESSRLYPPLYYAVATGSYEMVQLLLKYNFTNTRPKYNHYGSIYDRVGYIPNYEEMLSILLKHNIQGKEEKTKNLTQFYNQCCDEEQKKWCESLSQRWDTNDLNLSFYYEYNELWNKQRKLERNR